MKRGARKPQQHRWKRLVVSMARVRRKPRASLCLRPGRTVNVAVSPPRPRRRTGHARCMRGPPRAQDRKCSSWMLTGAACARRPPLRVLAGRLRAAAKTRPRCRVHRPVATASARPLALRALARYPRARPRRHEGSPVDGVLPRAALCEVAGRRERSPAGAACDRWLPLP